MNNYIKQIIILVVIFIIILWVQNNDDTKKNKTRKSYYDKIKLPLLATSLVGLFLNIDVEKLIVIKQNFIKQESINPNASINKIPMNYYSSFEGQEIFTSDFDAK